MNMRKKETEKERKKDGKKERKKERKIDILYGYSKICICKVREK